MHNINITDDHPIYIHHHPGTDAVRTEVPCMVKHETPSPRKALGTVSQLKNQVGFNPWLFHLFLSLAEVSKQLLMSTSCCSHWWEIFIHIMHEGCINFLHIPKAGSSQLSLWDHHGLLCHLPQRLHHL